MPDPKAQHFIPRMILKRFSNEDGKLFAYNTRFATKEVTESIPANIFKQNHLYTAKTKDGERDYSLEIQFSELETKTDPIIEKIVTLARSESPPDLTNEEKTIWNEFLYYQWKRVPDTIDSYASNNKAHPLIIEELANYENNFGPLPEEKREEILSEAGLKRIQQNAKVRAIAAPGDEVQKILAQRGLCVAIIPDKRKSFIIGSNPIAKLTLPNKSHLADPTVEVWFAIASDVAISPGSHKNQNEIRVIKDHSHIRRLNEVVTKQSSVIAARSKELIQSLIARR